MPDEPQSLDDLVQATGADRANVYRLLRLLVALEVLSDTERGLFQATPLSRLLQTDAPLYYLALMADESWNWQVQGGAEGTGYSLRSGKPAFAHLYGTDIWGYLKAHPQEALIFNRAMNNTVGVPDGAIAQALTHSTISRLFGQTSMNSLSIAPASGKNNPFAALRQANR